MIQIYKHNYTTIIIYKMVTLQGLWSLEQCWTVRKRYKRLCRESITALHNIACYLHCYYALYTLLPDNPLLDSVNGSL